jgi:serine/threonine-protein kinase
MASVHLAQLDGPGGFRKQIAVKRIHPWLAEEDGFIDMFLDEARIAGAIAHPNVAHVFALGRDEETYWLAMEFLRGRSLRAIMANLAHHGRRMVWPVAARIVIAAAEGLHAAHELCDEDGAPLHVVHRDATPHNIFVGEDGTVKVVDFGVAKALGRLGGTVHGMVKGKLAYLSPEQHQQRPVDRRTDVYALGVVLWELVTGRRLFRRDSDVETLRAVTEGVVPPPRALRRDCPPGLERIIFAALAPSPSARTPTARALALALRQLLVTEGLVVPACSIGDLAAPEDHRPSALDDVTVVLSPEPHP